MKKVLILCAHRPQRSPSQRYRFEQYLPFLEQNGYSFTYSFLLNERSDTIFYSQGNFFRKVLILVSTVLIRLKDCLRFKNFDLIFIQREASFLGTSFFEKCAYRSGARVIFDFDDSIWLADTSPGNKKWEGIKRPQKFYTNLRRAHVVIAGNSYLAAKAKTVHPNTVIVPTTIDTDHHVPKPQLRNGNSIVIGWSGSLSTIKHFTTLLPVFSELKEKYGNKIKFKIIADKMYSEPSLNLEVAIWSPETEVDELNSFDIGVMPLPDDEWARGKCGLKGLSYMACGIATIMSPVGVNTEIIEHKKNGLLAQTAAEWTEAISMLIENKIWRDELGEAGRKTVVERYSVEAQKNAYLEIFRHA
ncbi:MAG: glycosyltransferase family 4 protein [bacterium]|nr:glycosyltransferase family 4 protein [bacterium]